MKRLTGRHLILEPVTPANAVTLWRIMGRNDLREFQDVPRYTRDEFERRVASRPKRFDARATGRFEWLILIAQTRKAIGWVSLRVGDHARGSAEIGYSIAGDYRGNGYATEATRLVVDFAFEESDLQMVEACCVPANLASRRLLASLDFVETRVQHNGAIVRGRPVDIVLFEMPREGWERRDRRNELYDESANSIEIPASANPK